ncbi:MAG: hypothetical protein ACREK4_13570 [Candidatus Rokuibacteriota bacterium]
MAIPAMVFAQDAPGAWCAGSYGAEGTNFGPCPAAQAGAQVAGQASGIQSQSVATQPQYPASQVNFRDGKAYFQNQELNLNFKASAERFDEIEAPGSSD